jgi:hypothetical protein
MQKQPDTKSCSTCADDGNCQTQKENKPCFGCSKHKPKKAAPLCPHCDEPLESVDYYPYEQYVFKDGFYQLDEMSQSAEIKCPKCGNDVDELFPEGPVNYSTEEKEPTLSLDDFRTRFNSSWETAPGMPQKELQDFYDAYKKSGKNFEDWIKEL